MVFLPSQIRVFFPTCTKERSKNINTNKKKSNAVLRAYQRYFCTTKLLPHRLWYKTVGHKDYDVKTKKGIIRTFFQAYLIKLCSWVMLCSNEGALNRWQLKYGSRCETEQFTFLWDASVNILNMSVVYKWCSGLIYTAKIAVKFCIPKNFLFH